jgi:hypothetical protein
MRNLAPFLLTTTLALASCAHFGEELAAPSASSLAGTYVSNPSPLDAVVLKLAANGSYDARWEGCMGEYGSAAGTWSLAGDGVALTPAKDGELFFATMSRLVLVPYKGRYSLARPEDVANDRVGASELFTRESE